MKFLMGLNNTYMGIKAQILLIKPFPSLNEVYSIIQQEEKRKEIWTQGCTSISMALFTRDNCKEGGSKTIQHRIKTGITALFVKSQGTPLKDASKLTQENQFVPTTKFLVMVQTSVSSSMVTHQATNSREEQTISKLVHCIFAFYIGSGE